MTHDGYGTGLIPDLLRLAPLDAENAEQAQERAAARLARPLDPLAFHAAVAACLRDGMIHDPVRLEAGALQCRWRLELTPKGVDSMKAA